MRRMEFSLGRKLTVLIVVLDITLSTMAILVSDSSIQFHHGSYSVAEFFCREKFGNRAENLEIATPVCALVRNDTGD